MRRAILGGCALGLATGWNVSNTGAVAQQLAHRYGVGLATVGLLTTALFLTHLLMQIPGGDAVYFLITSWPGQKVNNEPSIIIGYAFKPGTEATVQVGSDKFQFFTKDDGAWLASREDEQKLIAAMRAAAEVTVKGMSKRGTLTTDTYSLKGISGALDKAAEGCK